MSAKKKNALGSGAALACSLDLMTSLTASPDNRIETAPFMREHQLDDEKLNAIIDLLQSIADERTGARIALQRDGDTVSMLGNAGALSPLRLRPSEAAALRLALDRCHIDPATQARIAAALAPTTGAADERKLLSADDLFGEFFPTIAEALAIGARLRMSYRADGEASPAERTIDPLYIEVAGQAAYLVAWNVDKDEQRSYRLDRIADLGITDESVVAHPATRSTTSQSIIAHGQVAWLHWRDRGLFDLCTWAGLHRDEAKETADGVDAPVSYTSRTWLFDRVLAGGGNVVLTSPDHLRTEFVEYARKRAGLI